MIKINEPFKNLKNRLQLQEFEIAKLLEDII